MCALKLVDLVNHSLNLPDQILVSAHIIIGRIPDPLDMIDEYLILKEGLIIIGYGAFPPADWFNSFQMNLIGNMNMVLPEKLIGFQIGWEVLIIKLQNLISYNS